MLLYYIMIFFNLGIIQEVLHKTEGILLTPVAFLALGLSFVRGLFWFALVWRFLF